MKEILEEEFDEMDFEDIIGGDLKTRFRYTKVKPNSFGYGVDELLELPEQVIKERVSIKRIAPYREKEYKPYPRHKKAEKLKAYELRKKENARHYFDEGRTGKTLLRTL